MEKLPKSKLDEHIEDAIDWMAALDAGSRFRESSRANEIAIAQVHATLAVAEAIREQTAGIKASLAVIAEYLEP